MNKEMAEVMKPPLPASPGRSIRDPIRLRCYSTDPE
jgi:hypothetical protein